MQTTRQLSVFDTVCLGINAIIGSGIFIFPGQLAYLAGPASILAFGLCGLLLLLVALCYAELGSMYRQSGGPYVYARAAFGPGVGFSVGWVSWVTSIFSWATVANAVSSALAYFHHGFKEAYVAKGVAVLVIVSFGLVNYRGIKLGARTIDVFTIAKLAPLLLLVLVGAFSVAPANYHPFWHGSRGSFCYAIFLVLWTLQGFEVTPFPSGESVNPQRAVPIAALCSLAGATLVYVLVQAVAIGVHPGLATDEASVKPLAEAAVRCLGRGGGVLIALGAVISMVGYNGGNALGSPRLLSALAEDRHLPPRLATPHPRFRTPGAAILTTSGLTAAAAVFLSLQELVHLSNLVVILQYLATCSALVCLRLRQPQAPRQFRLPAGIPVALAGCAVALGLALSLWLADRPAPRDFLVTAGVVALGFAARAAYRLMIARSRAPLDS
jgi:amino acid transporter